MSVENPAIKEGPVVEGPFEQKGDNRGENCQACGRCYTYVWWCCDQSLWDEVSGKAEHLCIECFTQRAKTVGVFSLEWTPLRLRDLHPKQSFEWIESADVSPEVQELLKTGKKKLILELLHLSKLKYIEARNQRYRDIKHAIGFGLSEREIGKAVGLSGPRINQIKYSAPPTKEN